jgi:hypothetical protein
MTTTAATVTPTKTAIPSTLFLVREATTPLWNSRRGWRDIYFSRRSTLTRSRGRYRQLREEESQ